MGAALVILQLAIPLLLQIPSLVQMAEQAFSHVDKSGTAKKALVQQVVQTGLTAASTIGKVKELQDPTAQKTIVDAAGALTDAVVAGYNAAGAWGKTPAAIPPQA